MRHHDEAIERYVARVSTEDDNLAVIVTGSLARGTEKPTSDVDLYLLVTEDAWAKAWDARRLMYTETEGIDYAGGYYDVKLATLSYLDDAADRGDDPVRDSFAHSRIAFSRVDDLEERLERASVVPIDVWESRAASYLAQVRLHGNYFLVKGWEAGDPLLTTHAAVHLVTSASRALLALGHVTFQGPKYLAKAVAALDRKPLGWEGIVDRLLTEPTPDTARALVDTLEAFHDWGLPREETLSTFILDNELAWRYRTKTPEYF